MTFRDAAIATAGSINATSVQVVVPSSVQVGDVLVFAFERGGTNSAADLSLASSNSGSFTQVDPAGSGLGSVGTLSKYAIFTRTAVSGDAGSTVTGTSAGTGRHLLAVAALSGVDAASIVVASTAPSSGTGYGFPAAVPASGSTGGTVLRIALGSVNSVGSTFTLPGGSPVTERQQATTSGTTGANVFGFVGSQEFTGETVTAASVTGSESTSHKRTISVTLSSTVTPTVNATAPADAAVQVGGSAFSLVGTDSTTGGATITSRLWTRTAGVTVTMSGTTTNTLVVTPPSSVGTGSTTFRYAVSGTPGSLSDFDEVTITWSAASTGPVPFTQGPGWVDARAAGTPVSLAQTSGTAVTISEPTEGVFLLSGGGVFLLTTDNNSADPTPVTVASAGGSVGPEVVLYVHDGATWRHGADVIDDPSIP